MQTVPGKAWSLALRLCGPLEAWFDAFNLIAATTIASAGLETSQQVVALIVFVLLASISIAAPVLYYLAAGASAEETLNSWKAWLIANNGAMMAVLFLVFRVKLIGDALGGLIG
jgi:hypothetical protein